MQGWDYQRLMGWAVTQSLPQLILPLDTASSPTCSPPPLAGSLLPFQPLHPHSTQAK